LSEQTDDQDIENPPNSTQLLGWGEYLELLLGVEKGSTAASDHEFSFPWILRRVETLSILTEDGEQRHLSLDIDVGTIKSCRTLTAIRCNRLLRQRLTKMNTQAQEAMSGWHKGDNTCASLVPPLLVYNNCMPIPFALFSKGVLLDFSAKLGDRVLSLEKKNTCILAGFAWLMLSAPDQGNHINPELRKQLWWICRHRPKNHFDNKQRKTVQVQDASKHKQLGTKIKQLATKLGRSLAVLWQLVIGTMQLELSLELPETERTQLEPSSFCKKVKPPAYWFLVKSQNPNIADNNLPDDLAREFYQLLFDNGQPTEFYFRLKLLSANYFPLVVVPFDAHDSARAVLKFDFLYGDSDEMWIAQKEKSRREKARRKVFDQIAASGQQDITDVSDTTAKVVGIFRYLRALMSYAVRRFLSSVFPNRAWPWSVTLVGDLEGHCEHTHIVLPSNVELVGGSWDDPSKELKENVVEQELLPSANQSQLNGDRETEAGKIQKESHVKFFRNMVTIRRHRSLRRGSIILKFGLLPSLDGVFAPLLIAQILLLLCLLIALGSQTQLYALRAICKTGIDAFGSASLWFGMIPMITAAVVRRFDQPLRAMMLRRIYRRSIPGVIAGTTALYAFILTYNTVNTVTNSQNVQLPSSLMGAATIISIAAVVPVLYATYFLVHTRIILACGRRRLNNNLGRTRQLRVSK